MAERGELGVEVEDMELVDPTLAIIVVAVVFSAAFDEDAEGEEADPVLANCCCCCCCGGNCCYCCCPLVNTESSSYIVEVRTMHEYAVISVSYIVGNTQQKLIS